MGSNHNTLQLLFISTLWAMMVSIVPEGLVGTFSTLLRSGFHCDIKALDVSHDGGTMMQDHVAGRWQLVPTVVTSVKLTKPSLTKCSQPVNTDEVTAVEGLKEGFDPDNNKGWSMDNLFQNAMILEGSFRSRTIIATLVPKRHVKLIHTIEELILRGNEWIFLARKFKVNKWNF